MERAILDETCQHHVHRKRPTILSEDGVGRAARNSELQPDNPDVSGDHGVPACSPLGVVPPRGRVHHDRLRAKLARHRGPHHLVRVCLSVEHEHPGRRAALDAARRCLRLRLRPGRRRGRARSTRARRARRPLRSPPRRPARAPATFRAVASACLILVLAAASRQYARVHLGLWLAPVAISSWIEVTTTGIWPRRAATLARNMACGLGMDDVEPSLTEVSAPARAPFSVKIRVETIAHYLERYAGDIIARKKAAMVPGCPL